MPQFKFQPHHFLTLQLGARLLTLPGLRFLQPKMEIIMTLPHKVTGKTERMNNVKCWALNPLPVSARPTAKAFVLYGCTANNPQT